MRSNRSDVDSRPGRRIRTRLTRVLAFAVAAPVMAGSLAYAAGVEPVRRRVDDFLKGTAGFFRKAESSRNEFHLSPNPSGQGVLVMPLDDRGPRAAARDAAKSNGNSKESSSSSKKKSEPDEREPKNASTGSSVADPEDSKAKDTGEEESGSGESDDDRSGSDSGSDGGDHDHSGSGHSDSASEKD